LKKSSMMDAKCRKSSHDLDLDLRHKPRPKFTEDFCKF